MNNRTYKVSFFYLILLMVLLFFVSEFAKRAEMQNLYTYTQFQEDIESGIVERAVIIQNEGERNNRKGQRSGYGRGREAASGGGYSGSL